MIEDLVSWFFQVFANETNFVDLLMFHKFFLKHVLQLKLDSMTNLYV